jgi:uncharacterized protein (DUF362 family)
MSTAPRLDRRAMLRRLAHAGLLFGGCSALGALGVISKGRWGHIVAARVIPDHRVAAPAGRPSIAVARGAVTRGAVDPARLVAAALEPLGGMGAFVRAGDIVLLKPNMAWDRTVEQGANTHPAIVAETVRRCRAAGAQRVLVAEVPVHDGVRCAERSGIRRAALEAGAEVVLPPAAAFTPAQLGGTVLSEWDVLEALFLATKLINLPVVKDHALSRMTCGFKNWYGLLGGTRARLHQDIHPSIADLGAAMRPTLTIVDATRVMMRGGPTGGRLDDVALHNAVAAGTDPVALDAWAARELSLDPHDVGHIVLAEGKGLGSIRAGLEVGEGTRVD